MSEYPYLASIIVPVYNVGKFVKKCLNSLEKQTIEFSKIEILLINDGSTDNSEEICREFSDKYNNVFLFSKENEGLSKTRNYGLERVHGKYIFYLDSDDMLREDTIKSVTDYFETVYNETDMVTYRLIPYHNGTPVLVHFRYMTLTKTGIYDLRDPKNRFITQTNINICVKNRGEENVKFDFTPGFRHEDEKYSCDVLRRLMTIGFCSEGEYIYNKDNIDSIVSTAFAPEKIFDSSLDFYEALFDSFDDKVPEYYQGIVFNDFRWKLMDKKLLPLHLDGDDWKNANRRVDRLLQRMNEDTIVLHPSVNINHLCYWIKRRRTGCPCVVADKNGITLFLSGKKIFTVNKFKTEIIESNGMKKIIIKSPLFIFIDRRRFEIIVDGKAVDYDLCDDVHSKDFNPDGNYPCVSTMGSIFNNIAVKIDGFEYRTY